MKIQRIVPDQNCKACFGTGTVYDSVPYGSTNVSMPSICSCVEEQIDDDTDRIEVVKFLEPPDEYNRVV